MGRIKRESNEERLRILGNVKVGGKKTINRQSDGKQIEIPESYDYFVADGDYADEFRNAFPDENGKPSKIEITFLSDNEDVNCDERFELRTKKKLFAYGDGEIFNVYDEKIDDFKIVDLKKCGYSMEMLLSDAKKLDKKASWTEILYLRFLILRLNHILGVFEFKTRGKKSSIKEIRSSYDLVKNITGGRVRGIPFDLSVKKVTSQKVGSKHSFPVVSLTANKGYENLEMVAKMLDEGVELRGLLTDDRINEIQEKVMIDYKPSETRTDVLNSDVESPSENVKAPTEQGKAEIQAQFDNISDNNADLSKKMQAIKKLLQSSHEKGNLDSVSENLKSKSNFNHDELQELDLIIAEIKHKI